ncbi:hypothetical protein GR217_22810 [Rhizobium leguminosarum]|uniref:Uncharacterized protein n=1 Tax=Rhizobium ruizarguesonis TaxID=2081791 RepID=A0AAE5C3F5_9HYPH|nr:hypothetical protein [Rhizobium ruizarguesonis]NEI50519.1 hypothetical protein [Rhizobium ruizarguesonis]
MSAAQSLKETHKRLRAAVRQEEASVEAIQAFLVHKKQQIADMHNLIRQVEEQIVAASKIDEFGIAEDWLASKALPKPEKGTKVKGAEIARREAISYLMDKSITEPLTRHALLQYISDKNIKLKSTNPLELIRSALKGFDRVVLVGGGIYKLNDPDGS